jgi:hypothetical protein
MTVDDVFSVMGRTPPQPSPPIQSSPSTSVSRSGYLPTAAPNSAGPGATAARAATSLPSATSQPRPHATAPTATTASVAAVPPRAGASPSISFTAPVAPASTSSTSTARSGVLRPGESAAASGAPSPLSTSSSPSKRKRQTPRKRKIDAVATEVIGHSKTPRTAAHSTPSAATTASTTTIATTQTAADTAAHSADSLFVRTFLLPSFAGVLSSCCVGHVSAADGDGVTDDRRLAERR